MLKRVEKHIIINNKNLDNLCFLSKNLYNYANYCVRRRFIKSGRFLSAYTLIKILTKINQIDYRSLSAQTAQQVLLQLEQSWKSFFKVIKDYKKNPSKYKAKPNLPNFKKKKLKL